MALPALADYETAILALLDDASNARYTNLQVDEALRWAVIQYVEAKPAAVYAIKDLDAAATTTLLAVDTVNVQVGAAGYAMLMRSISRSESINMQPEVAAQLRATSEIFLAEFKKILDLYSNEYSEKLALETAKYAAETIRDAALDTDNIAMQTQKAAADIALKAAGETAKYAADIALQAAKADNSFNKSMSNHFEEAFKFGLLNAARQPFPSVPDCRKWNDEWQGWS